MMEEVSADPAKHVPRDTRSPLSLRHTLRGHTDTIMQVAWSPGGQVLASGSRDNTIRLWNGETGQELSTLTGHTEAVYSIAWSPDGQVLASGSGDQTIRLWNGETGQELSTLTGHTESVASIAWSPDGQILASGSYDQTIRLWNGETGQELSTLTGHTRDVNTIVWSPDGQVLASGSDDQTIRLWNRQTGQELSTLEGHTDPIACVSFSSDGRFLASKSQDGTIRIWRTSTWETVEIIEEASSSAFTLGLVFHPCAPILATLGEKDTVVRIWDVDFEALSKAPAVNQAVYYTTAKIALVGESGVGKSGLGYRIAEGRFQVTESTHGQHFRVVDSLGATRSDGTQCEAVLWDFAGQSNFRPIHALFLDDIDLALVLFDPSRPDTLAGVDYWLKQLAHKQQLCNTVLVAARADVSKMALSPAELETFCRERAIRGGFLATSAKTNLGIDELVERIRQQIDWDARPTTITTQTFKRVKDYVLSLKTDAERKNVLVSEEALRELLEETDPNWQFSDAELLGAVGHLQNHGYVTMLRRSSDEQSILLAPDVLINLASRYLLNAQANEKGLGSLEEGRALRNEYAFEEVENLDAEERDTLLNAVAELFLSRNLCFRESIDNQTFLIFPSLILERPPRLVEDVELVEDMAYIVTGQIENVYAALVVLLGYSPSFQRINQWRKQAQYETARGEVCGFKLANDDAAELELVLYYGKETPDFVRARFQGLFEEILHSRQVTIKKYAPLVCPRCGSQQERRTVIRFLEQDETYLFCAKDGKKLRLPKPPARVALSRENRAAVGRDQALMKMRTSYETALSSVKRYLHEKGGGAAPTCFISYAWGNAVHERWVVRLADDLRKADLSVVLDRWDNAAIGANIARFIERIELCTFVLTVGTPAYIPFADPLVRDLREKLLDGRDRLTSGKFR